MDRGFLHFIIGCILILPLIFLIIRLNIYLRKKGHKDDFVPPRHDLNDPTDPTSLWNFHRRNPPPG
jgi:hypothetical protein